MQIRPPIAYGEIRQKPRAPPLCNGVKVGTCLVVVVVGVFFKLKGELIKELMKPWVKRVKEKHARNDDEAAPAR